jgi:hypothetical protein
LVGVARRRADAVAWLRELFPDRPLLPDATDDDLRAALASGRLLCALLRRLCPGALLDDSATDNAGRFRAAIQRMAVPTFSAYDLERVAFPFFSFFFLMHTRRQISVTLILHSRAKCQLS